MRKLSMGKDYDYENISFSFLNYFSFNKKIMKGDLDHLFRAGRPFFSYFTYLVNPLPFTGKQSQIT
jgi:hypothetical protein